MNNRSSSSRAVWKRSSGRAVGKSSSGRAVGRARQVELLEELVK